MHFLLSVCLSAVVSSAVAKDRSGIWRYPYNNNPYVHNNPRDGYPDFSLFDRRAKFTSKTISCPAELQKPCCEAKAQEFQIGELGAEACPSACSTRLCAGGLYCENYIHKQQQPMGGLTNDTATWCPHYAGTGDKGKAVPRTRTNILQRGIGWLAVHAPYIGCHTPDAKYTVLETCAQDDPKECPTRSYTGSCEGLITNAWGTPGYAGKGDDFIIDCKDALPGDSMSFHAKGGGIAHVMLFREWAVPRKGNNMRVYQMGGGSGSANMADINPKVFCKFPVTKGVPRKSCYSCNRYAHIVNETATAVGVY